MSHRTTALRGAALCAAFLALGCDLAPDVGPPLTDRCTNTDSDPASDVTWNAHIAPLFSRDAGGCAACHDALSPNPVGILLANLDLSSYADALRGGSRSATDIVIPGQPCESVLYQKVTAGPPFGSRMPLDGPPFLTLFEQTLVHDWIAEGAREH